MTTPATLRRLYLARTAFAVAWAILAALAPDPVDARLSILLVLYPLVDVAAVLVEARASTGATRTSAYAGAAVSLVAAVALGWAAQDSVAAVLVVWGAWAIAAGATQLLTAASRRALGGQWPLIASGGLSTLVGAGFVAQGAGDADSLGSIAGYAAAGGVFFLVSAVRLGRRRSGTITVGAEGIEPPTTSL
jgi:uncharacterized membrane protein HdeD (DUF308 family)